MGKDSAPRRRKATVNIYEAKTHFSDLIDQVAKGEEIVISRRGKPVARLAPIPGRGIKFGILKGKLTVPADFDAPLPPDIQRWFDGGADDE
ncbi:MAG TPA: type II toxin-antitoxin system Phd/YefM family antitoxin [Gemmatimonadaceae bacterium]|nr:type II toxin-antitoxin system Phd/YefM family antitoxin [Gemmatimonadaceae bacterium]